MDNDKMYCYSINILSFQNDFASRTLKNYIAIEFIAFYFLIKVKPF